MAQASIPVDLTNPGQVFACLGFAEAADLLLGSAAGGFDWRDPGDVRFRVTAAGDESPILRVLRFLKDAKVTLMVPAGFREYEGNWGPATETTGAFPFPAPDKPASLPACLQDADGRRIVIDHWGDQTKQTRRDNVKFWAGMGGAPGTTVVASLLDLVRDRLTENAEDPFALSTRQKGSLRFDWRRDCVPIDVGFSPNAHANLQMRGYPIVDLMAAIGLSHARPMRKASKLEYCYGAAGLIDADLYDLVFLRASLGAEEPLFPGMPLRCFRMWLDWPGQEGQARCITNVIEESQS